MKKLTLLVLFAIATVSLAAEQQIIYRVSDGAIVCRAPLDASFGKLSADRAAFIADIDPAITHVTTETVPVQNRKNIVKPKKSREITADTIAAVDALIEAVADKKTQDALKALKSLIVEELPDQ